MARIATIKPDFWCDPSSNTMSLLSRYILIGLWAHCNNKNKVDCSLKFIKKTLLYNKPYGIKTHNKCLSQILKSEYIISIQNDIATMQGQRYLGSKKDERMSTLDVRRWMKLRGVIFERDGYKCTYCGSKDFLQCDHVISVYNGGSDDIDNLTTACRTCNLRKGKHSVDFFKAKYF